MRVPSFEICRCRCHRFPDGVYEHVEPCCATCQFCGMRIRKDYYRLHYEECSKNRIDSDEAVDE